MTILTLFHCQTVYLQDPRLGLYTLVLQVYLGINSSPLAYFYKFDIPPTQHLLHLVASGVGSGRFVITPRRRLPIFKVEEFVDTMMPLYHSWAFRASCVLLSWTMPIMLSIWVEQHIPEILEAKTQLVQKSGCDALLCYTKTFQTVPLYGKLPNSHPHAWIFLLSLPVPCIVLPALFR